MRRDVAVQDAANELDRAMGIHAPMHSYHEGYAVILEELDELWDEIKKRSPDRARIRTEATHVAAMALRFMVDTCPGESDK